MICCSEPRTTPFCPQCGRALIKRSRKIDPTRQALVYGYCRVSTDRQATSGVSLDAQDKYIGDYFTSTLTPRGLIWAPDHADGYSPGMFVEPISAYKVPFARRAQGARILHLIEPGDHLVVAKVDRGFRDLYDFAVTYRELEDRGVILHVIDVRFDASDEDSLPFSRALLEMRVVFGALESRMNAQRVKDAHTIRRIKGLHISGPAPNGFKLVGPKGSKRVVPDENMREIMLWIIQQRDVQRVGFSQIAAALTADGCRRKLKNKKERYGYSWEPWDSYSVRKAYLRMKQILEADKKAKVNGSA